MLIESWVKLVKSKSLGLDKRKSNMLSKIDVVSWNPSTCSEEDDKGES